MVEENTRRLMVGTLEWSEVARMVALVRRGIYRSQTHAGKRGKLYLRENGEERHVQAGGGLRKAGAPDCSGKSALALEFDYLDRCACESFGAAINSFPIEGGEKKKKVVPLQLLQFPLPSVEKSTIVKNVIENRENIMACSHHANWKMN